MCKHSKRFEKETLHQVLHILCKKAHHRQLAICHRWSWSKLLPNKNWCKFPFFPQSPAYLQAWSTICIIRIEICFCIDKFIYLHDCMNARYHRIRLKIWHLANQKFCMFWVFAAEAATGVGFGITYPHRGSVTFNLIYIVSYSTYCPSSCIVKSGARARVVN